MPIMTWEPVVPAVPLLSTSAEHIFAGLAHHDVTAPLHQFTLELARLSTIFFDIAESDGE